MIEEWKTIRSCSRYGYGVSAQICELEYVMKWRVVAHRISDPENFVIMASGDDLDDDYIEKLQTTDEGMKAFIRLTDELYGGSPETFIKIMDDKRRSLVVDANSHISGFGAF